MYEKLCNVFEQSSTSGTNKNLQLRKVRSICKIMPPTPPKTHNISSANHQKSYCTTATTPNITQQKITSSFISTPPHHRSPIAAMQSPAATSAPGSTLPSRLCGRRRSARAAATRSSRPSIRPRSRATAITRRSPTWACTSTRRCAASSTCARGRPRRLPTTSWRPWCDPHERVQCRRESGCADPPSVRSAKCNFAAKRIVLDLRRRRAIGQTS